jgi:hypothetical protein
MSNAEAKANFQRYKELDAEARKVGQAVELHD